MLCNKTCCDNTCSVILFSISNFFLGGGRTPIVRVESYQNIMLSILKYGMMKY